MAKKIDEATEPEEKQGGDVSPKPTDIKPVKKEPIIDVSGVDNVRRTTSYNGTAGNKFQSKFGKNNT